MQLNLGQRVALPDVVSSMNVEVGIDLQGIAVDVSCFGVDAAGRLADERYMTFFNQAQTPCGGVQLGSPAGFGAGFRLALDRLPPSIDRLLQEFPDWLKAARGKGIIR